VAKNPTKYPGNPRKSRKMAKNGQKWPKMTKIDLKQPFSSL